MIKINVRWHRRVMTDTSQVPRLWRLEVVRNLVDL
jgi:hypothetical protein